MIYYAVFISTLFDITELTALPDDKLISLKHKNVVLTEIEA